MKGVSAKDAKMLADAEALLGAEPTEMGFVKNLFWGNLREELLFPYPQADAEETARCDQLIAALDDYLRNEHPAALIDSEQEIPDWVIKKLFDLGVMGMTIPKEFGGLGMGVTSYVRVLEKIGEYCGSSAVLVSAHQSIGCKAVMLFGNEQQKKAWLPHLAREWVSAFCLSEPNVGCDAAGVSTTFRKSDDGEHYIITGGTGEKKWATSGAISGLFTVMAREERPDGNGKISALVVHPDMEGVEIYQKNRSKCGIRGTWQARIRFHNVKVPKWHLLHQEGRGLNVALTCLNYGRCTLSAGMLGGATRAMNQAVKWSRTRYQFQRPLSDWELVKARIANMAALCYAMDAMLYYTTGILDRKDGDIMVETAVCKTFCSEMGWRVVNDAMQIMGGESYMQENEVERIFRDSRINLIVEGANEVMQSFIFGYGGKQLSEQMGAVKNLLTWEGAGDENEGFGAKVARLLKNGFNPAVLKVALPLGLELFLGLKKAAPRVTKVHPSLQSQADRLCDLVREHSHQFKLAGKEHEARIIERQLVQARVADNAIYLHAMACTLSKLDRQIRSGEEGVEFERDRAAALHFLDQAEIWIRDNWRRLRDNADATLTKAAETAIAHSDTQPNHLFIVPETSPVAKGTGRAPRKEGVKQFPGGAVSARKEFV
ncbi:MAG: acyl-CoA dehydrogenase family protein [Phycisphaerales bacterium]|nr:acyl-CoA dehydrogenase family protein [Phycisphaerales bacterium]